MKTEDLNLFYKISGNYFTKSKYSEEEANEMANTLYQCGHCIDCTNCDYCEDCINCHDCDHCFDCTNCETGYNCYNCEECKGCESSRRCISCTDCRYCSSCRKCTNCEACQHCYNCNNDDKLMNRRGFHRGHKSKVTKFYKNFKFIKVIVCWRQSYYDYYEFYIHKWIGYEDYIDNSLASLDSFVEIINTIYDSSILKKEAFFTFWKETEVFAKRHLLLFRPSVYQYKKGEFSVTNDLGLIALLLPPKKRTRELWHDLFYKTFETWQEHVNQCKKNGNDYCYSDSTEFETSVFQLMPDEFKTEDIIDKNAYICLGLTLYGDFSILSEETIAKYKLILQII